MAIARGRSATSVRRRITSLGRDDGRARDANVALTDGGVPGREDESRSRPAGRRLLASVPEHGPATRLGQGNRVGRVSTFAAAREISIRGTARTYRARYRRINNKRRCILLTGVGVAAALRARGASGGEQRVRRDERVSRPRRQRVVRPVA